VAIRPQISPGRLPSISAAGKQQDQGVDQRQIPGVEGDDALRRPDAIRRAPGRDFQRVQVFGGREDRVFEEGPEPGREEHHLGHDEQDEAHAKTDPHHRRVVAGNRLADHIRPPGIHGIQHHDQAQNRQPRRDVMEHQDQSGKHGKGADGAQERPQAGVDDMVVVSFLVGHQVLRSPECVS
jgi:hypothetical protein